MNRKQKIMAVAAGIVVALGIGTAAVSSYNSSPVRGNGEFINVSYKKVIEVKNDKETKLIFARPSNKSDYEPFEHRIKKVIEDMDVNLYSYKSVYWAYDNGVKVNGTTGEKLPSIQLETIQMFPSSNVIKFFYKGTEVGSFDIDDYSTDNEGLQTFQKDFENFLKDMKKNYEF